jgi:hypothetical protein
VRLRRSLPACLVVGLIAGLLAPVLVAGPASANQARLRYAIKSLLVVKAETSLGYERSKFRHWIDANGDCQDTRAEVLIQESRVATTGGCTIRTGKWFSYYDGKTWRQASDVDIDHLVPLAEAWRSGAKRWNAGTRKRFANDLVDKRALVAVTDNVNQAKSDGDPAEWLPAQRRCRYVRQWVAVKLRWKLKVDLAEQRALLRVANNCANTRISWKPAVVRLGTSGGGGTGGSITGGLRFTRIVYNPDGDERYAPNGEKVYIKNVSGSRKNLQGVVLRDDDGHRRSLPSYGLGAGKTVIVHSGSGIDGGGHLYARWNTAVWNNDGDRAFLVASNGNVIDRCSYAGGGVSAAC